MDRISNNSTQQQNMISFSIDEQSMISSIRELDGLPPRVNVSLVDLMRDDSSISITSNIPNIHLFVKLLIGALEQDPSLNINTIISFFVDHDNPSADIAYSVSALEAMGMMGQDSMRENAPVLRAFMSKRIINKHVREFFRLNELDGDEAVSFAKQLKEEMQGMSNLLVKIAELVKISIPEDCTLAARQQLNDFIFASAPAQQIVNMQEVMDATMAIIDLSHFEDNES